MDKLHITQVQYLLVHYVNLQYMEAGVFDGQNIAMISLIGNKLTKMRSMIFYNIYTEFRDLSKNEIDFIEEGAFRNMLKLEQLILSQDKLTQI